ncbi:MAG: PDZ domain-containing protein [Parachlamydiaceae bacterium]|nr:PDZ domain-containing protein [Parachlamydiaceae bacterium]
MLKKMIFLSFLLCYSFFIESKLPEITPLDTTQKMQEMLKGHASYKTLTPFLVKRILTNFLEELDPNKTYFIEPAIHQWLEPTDALVDATLEGMKKGNFQTFDEVYFALGNAVLHRQEIDKAIEHDPLPKHVKAEEFKDMKWAKDNLQLTDRLLRIKSLQAEAAAKLNEKDREKTYQRIAKRKKIVEDEVLEKDPILRQKRILSYVLKATAAALDAHSSYFTPDEAAQFMIAVQQRLFGIGAQLRDDINGFTVIKIIDGGPAAEGKALKIKDRIIAINSEPVVGMDIIDAVDLIRGPENTTVTLTVMRQSKDSNDNVKNETIDINIIRKEVVLKESRFESSFEAYGDGGIGYLKLFSFYQDPDSSSADDLNFAISEMKKKTPLKAIVLDLRFNSGGMLSQAVSVSGLFITKGVVVSIKDENGVIQHLRHLDEEVAWGGPLIVLINRGSASASEIVAGTLQDYGRALIVGDDHSYGKGSFQTFTLNPSKNDYVNPQGEYKITRGRYYTVSGRTPQLTGVYSDINVPGILSEAEVGEKFTKFPLENDSIKPSFDDELDDIPASQRDNIKLLYKFNLQQRLTTYEKYLPLLISNSAERIKNNKPYQEFLKEIKKKDSDAEKEVEAEDEPEATIGKADLQLTETYNIVRDLLYLMFKNSKKPPSE